VEVGSRSRGSRSAPPGKGGVGSDIQPRSGCIAGRAFFDTTASRLENQIPGAWLPGVRCATPGFGIQPLRGCQATQLNLLRASALAYNDPSDFPERGA